MELQLLVNEKNIGNEISKVLKSENYKFFKFAVAYAKNSGIGRLNNDLVNFSDSGGQTEAIVGIDQRITSYQALVNLSSITKGNLLIHHDKGMITFHPKLYLFGNDNIEKIIIGSSNLTAGGLYTNFEANVDITLNESDTSNKFKTEVSDYWDFLTNDLNTKKADLKFIKNLFEIGVLSDENKQKSFKKIISKLSKAPFKTRPAISKSPPLSKNIFNDSPLQINNFAMTLSGFDVSDKSQDPVILIPITALKQFPIFWNWPNLYTYSDAGYPQFYGIANILIDRQFYKNQHIRIYYYNTKSEFRLQCEAIKRNGKPDDIMLVRREILTSSEESLEFNIELVRQNTKKYKKLIGSLNEKAGPKKVFKYF